MPRRRFLQAVTTLPGMVTLAGATYVRVFAPPRKPRDVPVDEIARDERF
jgi:hypothetical protein